MLLILGAILKWIVFMIVPLKIYCKKLPSGKCQVKFHTYINDHSYHGYLLTNPKDRLKDVMATINDKIKHKDAIHHHLYSIGKQKEQDFLLYKS